MNRRDFLKAFGTGAVALAVPRFTDAHNPLEYPLTSTPDIGTELDEQTAAKARKVAEYVMTRDKQKGLLHFDTELRTAGDYQTVQAVMEIDDWIYTVSVINGDENAKLKMPDLIYFQMRPKGTHGLDELIGFSDEGLDGRCNYGLIPVGLNATGQRLLYLAQSSLNPTGRGLQHKDTFQKLYGETLDKVIQFYERK